MNSRLNLAKGLNIPQEIDEAVNDGFTYVRKRELGTRGPAGGGVENQRRQKAVEWTLVHSREVIRLLAIIMPQQSGSVMSSQAWATMPMAEDCPNRRSPPHQNLFHWYLRDIVCTVA